MGKLMITTFLGLGLVFYEMSGGADFEPQSWDDVVAADATADSAPTAQPQVTRGQTASLIAVSAPAIEETTLEPTLAVATAPAEVIIAPEVVAPAAEPTVEVAVAEETIETQIVEEVLTAVEVPVTDLRYVAGNRVNMRTGPSTNYGVLDTLTRGTEAEVIEVDDFGWARVRITETGQIGWMAERLLSDA